MWPSLIVFSLIVTLQWVKQFFLLPCCSYLCTYLVYKFYLGYLLCDNVELLSFLVDIFSFLLHQCMHWLSYTYKNTCTDIHTWDNTHTQSFLKIFLRLNLAKKSVKQRVFFFCFLSVHSVLYWLLHAYLFLCAWRYILELYSTDAP